MKTIFITETPINALYANDFFLGFAVSISASTEETGCIYRL